ncbi:MAG: FkbM family methyltransferase [Alphaproteobacteria bacterium]|nr:FkbM family methyltransferase [Alphaproteobacteria bacterium]
MKSLLAIDNKVDTFLEARNDGGPIVLYGAGFAMPAILRKLLRYNFNVVGICDSSPALQGTKVENGLTISSVDEILGVYPNVLFVISTPSYFDEIYSELTERIGHERISDVDLECSHYFDAFEFKNFFSDNYLRFSNILERLEDEASMAAYKNVVRAHLTGERKDFQDAYTGKDDWYLFSSLLQPSKDSIYMDCGAFDGDTINLFIDAAKGEYAHIYAVEPDSFGAEALSNLEKTDSRISIVGKGLSKVEGEAELSLNGMYSSISDDGQGVASKTKIELTTIDNILDGGRADIIKMDIEGAEYDAIAGAKNTILKHRPKLAICLYHKVEDFVRIPELLFEWLPDHQFYVRHQSDSCTDTILFAVPR